MGQRGPAPTPSAINEMRGNPGKRARNHEEPQPTAGRPKMPGDLSKAAAAEWRRLVPILLSTRVLTVADGIGLAELCRMHALAGVLDAEIAAQTKRIEALSAKAIADGTPDDAPQHGALTQLKYTVDGAGNTHIEVKQNPLFAMRMAVSQKIKLYSAEFGLTPASRSRVRTVKAPAEVSEFAQRFGKPRTGAADGDGGSDS